MSQRRKGTSRKSRKASNRPRFRPIRNSERDFGNARAHGLQREFTFRRQLPLYEEDITDIRRFAIEEIKRNRKGYRLAFISLQTSVLGGLYEVKFKGSEDEEVTWEKKWVSTAVTPIRYIDGPVFEERLAKLLDKIENAQHGRPAWINRVRIVMYKPTK